MIIAGGYVGESEAGQRLFQVAHDPRCSKSGVYWSWNGGPREGRGAEALEKGGQISGGGGAGGGWDSIYENDQSAKVLDLETAMNLFTYSTDITKAEWPDLKAVTSPCPTLNVIGAVTKGMVQREEMKRMREMGQPGIDQEKAQVSRRKKVAAVADRVASSVLSKTVAPVARFASKRLLGEVPDYAKEGSFHAEQKKAETWSRNRLKFVSIHHPPFTIELQQCLIHAEASRVLVYKDGNFLGTVSSWRPAGRQEQARRCLQHGAVRNLS